MPFRARCNPTCLVRRQNALLAIRRGIIVPRSRLGGNAGSVTPVSTGFARHNSTSSLFSPLTSFFSRVKGPSGPSPEQASSDFTSSLASSQIDKLQSAYNVIISSPNAGQYLSEEQLIEAMRFLMELNSSQSLGLLQRIYQDLPDGFGYAITPEHQKLLITSLCNSGSVNDAFDWAQTMSPQSVDWRILLQTASKHDPSLVEPIATHARQHSSLDHTDYALLIRSIRNSHSTSTRSRTIAKLDDLLVELEENGVVLDWSTQAELMRLYISLGELEKANEIATSWDMSNIPSPGTWNAIAELYIARGDTDLVEETIGRMKDKGLSAPQKALTFLSLQNLQSQISSKSTVGLSDIIGSIESAERVCDIPASSDVWAEIVRLYLSEVKSHDSLDIAMEVYHEVLSRGIEVSAELARNIIIPLCNIRKTSRLPDAMRIYDDYLSSSNALHNRREKSRFSTVYQYLLVACSKSKPPSTIIAIRLLSDMRNHQIEITSTNLISLLIMLMKSSEDHPSAFNVYAHFYALSPGLIDESGYQAILTTFLNLSWERSPYPPPEYFIGMLKDMHKAGYQPGSHILAGLLKQYGYQATRLRRKARSATISSTSSTSISTINHEDGPELSVEEQLDNLGQSIRDIHTLIKLDPLISPDIPLLSSLMDSYARAGAFSECFEVWDELIQRRPRESITTVKQSYAASINVVLDACGWSYSLQRGRKAWNWAKRWNLIWEKKHYDSWLECLCRNGQLEEAGMIIFDEMGIDNVPPPDKESARIVLRFGRRENDHGRSREEVGQFVERLKEQKKDWFEELKAEGELEGR
ncbi:uncharacterized protein IL334_004577 [Kwoniella shivajii]|uniref:Pentatricopeptide repeat domain-containing protein n=1 Tax=Kwoniella shivajii TaxID=564305 RepID=A0ABZ1D137_9TREE|nr:hypothetical protein IL334_004577 [Kwoniella shivajii]